MFRATINVTFRSKHTGRIVGTSITAESYDIPSLKVKCESQMATLSSSFEDANFRLVDVVRISRVEPEELDEIKELFNGYD